MANPQEGILFKPKAEVFEVPKTKQAYLSIEKAVTLTPAQLLKIWGAINALPAKTAEEKKGKVSLQEAFKQIVDEQNKSGIEKPIYKVGKEKGGITPIPTEIPTKGGIDYLPYKIKKKAQE
ncbi:Uncharacterised protein [Candidatus Gugararchaeum adminiculabundum]|nr:Uncharacterised protein [Candidatus Gugararchaeum adminiculabundum]